MKETFRVYWLHLFVFRDLFRPRSADGFFELRDEAVEFRVFISEVLGEVVEVLRGVYVYATSNADWLYPLRFFV